MKIKEPEYKYAFAMLIDDNELDNFINEKTIEANMFAKKVYVHTSGKSAIDFLNNLITLEENQSNFFPQIIFVDINMPIMDGFQFIELYTKNLKEKINNPKVVILTSSLYPGDKQKSAEISKDIVFLNKPLTKEMLNTI